MQKMSLTATKKYSACVGPPVMLHSGFGLITVEANHLRPRSGHLQYLIEVDRDIL